MLAGFFVNGPYALITTAVSADLGTHESLQARALVCVCVCVFVRVRVHACACACADVCVYIWKLP
jgi:hypothetical protein